MERLRGRARSGPKPYDHFAQCHAVQFRSLNEDQLCLLHEASLEIMARTGMRFYLQEAIDLFAKAGAWVSDGNLVRIPQHLVEWALRTAPKNITIFDRVGRRAMSLGSYRSYFGPGSDCSYIYDLDTGQRRKAVQDKSKAPAAKRRRKTRRRSIRVRAARGPFPMQVPAMRSAWISTARCSSSEGKH